LWIFPLEFKGGRNSRRVKKIYGIEETKTNPRLHTELDGKGQLRLWLIKFAHPHFPSIKRTCRFSLSGLPRAVPTKKKGIVRSSALRPPSMLVVVTPLLGVYGTVTILSPQPHNDQILIASLIPTTARRSNIRCWRSSAPLPQFHQAHTTTWSAPPNLLK